MESLVFHSMAESAYLWTAMLAADEKGAPYRLERLDLHSPEHLRLHPFGKVPILQHGEVVLYETLAICHYIDRAFDGPALQPATTIDQAHTLRWISIVNAYVFPVMNRYVKERLVRPAWGFDPDMSFLRAARPALELQMSLIDNAVAAAPFLVGRRLTLADCFLLPHLLFFTRTAEGEALMAKHVHAATWLKRMTRRPSYLNSAMRQAFTAFAALAPSDQTSIWFP